MFEQERREYEICQREIKTLNLDMQLVDVEHLFGGERVVIYYLAEDRVDFRDLVKNAGHRVSNADRNAADRRPRRSQAAGRLRRLRQTGLLQHAPQRDAARLDEDGQAAKGDARPDAKSPAAAAA